MQQNAFRANRQTKNTFKQYLSTELKLFSLGLQEPILFDLFTFIYMINKIQAFDGYKIAFMIIYSIRFNIFQNMLRHSFRRQYFPAVFFRVVYTQTCTMSSWASLVLEY